MPGLWNATLIDGGTEPTNSNQTGPEILLNGSLAATPSVFAHGLHFRGTNCSVRSLIVNGFEGYGILIEGTNATGNAVLGCYLGIDPTGSFAVTNGISPIAIGSGASSNFIGSPIISDRNIISGSASQGVVIRNPGTKNNFVQGNFIGLNATGNAPLPNNYSGIIIYDGAQSNVIGGTVAGARNVISGNLNQGILIVNTNSNGNRIEGNYIGVSPTGDTAIPNGWAGIEISGGAKSNIVGGTESGTRNLISGNNEQGIVMFDQETIGNTVQGNYIGLNANGSESIANGSDGVGIYNGANSALIGGATHNARNLISGNQGFGVSIFGTNSDNCVIQGNFIGVDVSGLNGISNAFDGIFIGLGAKSNLVGGVLPTMRNIISGNGTGGISIAGPGTMHNRIEGNYIGLNVIGTGAISNFNSGISIFLGAQSNVVGGKIGARNFISGNGSLGIGISGTNTVGNLIQGNTIGLDAANNAAVPNGNSGINIFNAQSTQIGGLGLGVGNIIAANQFGVICSGAFATKNSIRANSIFGDIALFDGANLWNEKPRITTATMTTNLIVGVSVGLVGNPPWHFDSYVGFSKNYLGEKVVDEALIDYFALDAVVEKGQPIFVTVTDGAGNTSQFSDPAFLSAITSLNDGIPDAWRALYFGGNGTTTNNQSCATCDPDGDGANNSEEFFAGTNPTNAASFFQISSALTPNGVVVDLPSVNGISYRLESRDALEDNGWSILVDQIIGTGANIPVIDPASSEFPKKFYRGRILH